MLLKGLPFTKSSERAQAEGFLIQVFDRLGLQARRDRTGCQFSVVAPEKFSGASLSANNASSVLPYHTDLSYLTHPPPYVALYCLQGSAEARTFFLHRRSVLSRLSAQEVSVLQQPLYQFPYVEKVATYFDELVPVVSPDETSIRYNPFAKADGLLQNTVLKKYVDTVESTPPEFTLTLEPGDLLMWNNGALIHGRSAFGVPPEEEASRRMLLRAHLYPVSESML